MASGLATTPATLPVPVTSGPPGPRVANNSAPAVGNGITPTSTASGGDPPQRTVMMNHLYHLGTSDFTYKHNDDRFLPQMSPDAKKEWLRKSYALLLLQFGLMVGGAYLLNKFPETISWVKEHLYVLVIVAVLAVANLSYIAAQKGGPENHILYLATFMVLKTFLWAYLIDTTGQTENAIRLIIILAGVFLGQLLYTWKADSPDVWTQGALFTGIAAGAIAAYGVYLNMPFKSTKEAAIIIGIAFILTTYIKTATYVAGIKGDSDDWIRAAVALYFCLLGIVVVFFYMFRARIREAYHHAVDLMKDETNAEGKLKLPDSGTDYLNTKPGQGGPVSTPAPNPGTGANVPGGTTQPGGTGASIAGGTTQPGGTGASIAGGTAQPAGTGASIAGGAVQPAGTAPTTPNVTYNPEFMELLRKIEWNTSHSHPGEPEAPKVPVEAPTPKPIEPTPTPKPIEPIPTPKPIEPFVPSKANETGPPPS